MKKLIINDKNVNGRSQYFALPILIGGKVNHSAQDYLFNLRRADGNLNDKAINNIIRR